jgi:hypothetical protein
MNTQQWIFSYLLEPFSYFLFFTALLAFLQIRDKKLRHKILTVYYFLGFILLVKIVFTKNNSYLYSYLYLLVSISLSLYFFFLFETQKRRWLTLIPGIATSLYYLVERYSITEAKFFPSIGFVISSTGIILMIFVYFFHLITHVEEESLFQNFDFWFTCSQLMYHLGSFGIFLTYNKLTLTILPTEHYSNENRDLLTYLWGAHNVLLFVGGLITWLGMIWIIKNDKIENYKEIKS